MSSPRLSLLALALTATACGGTAGGGPAPHTTTGIGLPSEISALPPKAAVQGAQVSAVLPGGDYAAAPVVKYVDERALAQFDILNTIFGAVGQTHYADAANVEGGAYAAIVSWLDGGDGQGQKQLVRWVIRSSMAQVDGAPVNQVRVWFYMPDHGVMRIIPVALDIREAPTKNADGTYADYGTWTLRAKLAPDGSRFFVAAADHTGGVSRVLVHDSEQSGETKGILVRGADVGYGKVVFPDMSQCNGDGCTPPAIEVAYAYDAQNVALDKGGAVHFKSRTDSVDIVDRYGVFDLLTGDDTGKSHHFGFPLRYGADQYAYYGAWQGRHQIWANGDTLDAGVTVYRGDWRGTGAAPAYVTSPEFRGTLTKRTYAPSSLDDVAGMVFGTWVNENVQLTYGNQGWSSCVNPGWDPQAQQPTCAGGSGPVSDLGLLQTNPQDRARSVNINVWDGVNGSRNLVYDGAHFWVASGQPPQSNGTEWIPALDSRLWVNINENAWVYWNTQLAAWRQKQVLSFAPGAPAPIFDDQEKAFTFGPGDHMLNANGINYVVSPTAGGFDVQIERQTVPNPLTASTVVPAGLRFRRTWADAQTVFVFGTDPGAAGFMSLRYETPGPQDSAAGHVAHEVVAEQIWNLSPEQGGVPTGEAFSWDYPQQDGNGNSAQQYLLQDGAYVVLDDPLQFAPLPLTAHDGSSRSYALQFDGSWVNGLPNLYDQLRAAGYDVTPAIADQIVNIPEGTVVIDAAVQGKRYVMKPLQIRQYLLPIPDPLNLSLDAANALSLGDVPDYVDAGMGAPPSAAIKYSEGLPVP